MITLRIVVEQYYQDFSKLLALTCLLLNPLGLAGQVDQVKKPAVNDLAFMTGIWKTSGTQYWYDATWVQHQGIVECKLLEDGLTLERTFWAAFGNGASLGGKSYLKYNPENETWSSRWVPTIGKWEAGISIGRMEGEEYLEIARGSDASGKFLSKTRLFDISEKSYAVSTDLFYDKGQVSKNNWNIKFEKVSYPKEAERKGHRKQLDFMLGNWLAEGTMNLGNGSEAIHKSFVSTRLGDDGESIERTYWGAIGIGGALQGLSVHRPAKEPGVWKSQWSPTGGQPGAMARGEFVGEDFIETQQQQTANGEVTLKTRYFDISSAGYKVQTDVIQKDGSIMEAVWTVAFKKIN